MPFHHIVSNQDKSGDKYCIQWLHFVGNIDFTIIKSEFFKGFLSN